MKITVSYMKAKKRVPRGVGERERWTCNPRVSGSILGASNLKIVDLFMDSHKIIIKTSE